MSKDKKSSSQEAPNVGQLPGQTQSKRRLVYGSNVALTILLVIVIAAGLIYITQRYHHRSDITTVGLTRLKPQTLQVIGNNTEPIRLVSLYTTASDDRKLNEYAGTVSDLLSEYQRSGKNITVERIDPIRESDKLDALVKDLVAHDPQVEKYKALIETFRQKQPAMRQMILDEVAQTASLPINQLQGQQQSGSYLREIAAALPQMAQSLDEVGGSITRLTEKNPPDYAGAVEVVQRTLEALQHNADAITIVYAKNGQDASLPKPVLQYMAKSIDPWKSLSADCQAILADAQSLGQLKIDTIQSSLNEGQTVLVISPNDIRVLPFERIWTQPKTVIASSTDASQLNRDFSGEQEITTAIYSLTSKDQPTVVFVRSGGQPMTEYGGPFTLAAERLRQYNFKVLEKDISGQWQMQSQMSGMQAPPEATDQQMKDAIWVVMPGQSASLTGQMQPSVMPKLMEHLAAGKSALVLFDYQSDDLSDLMQSWGITVHTNNVMAHPEIQSNADSGSEVDQALRTSFFWRFDQYGDSPIATPLKSLDALLIRVCPVTLDKAPEGVKLWPVIQFPNLPEAWGEKSLQSPRNAMYSASEDATWPAVYAGALAEKADGPRLAVFGSLYYPLDLIQAIPDPAALKRNQLVPRFPGNGELFLNQIFWLARMDTMIAISPSAMTASRIAPMSEAAQRNWQIALVGALPAMVLISGIVVAIRRRG